MNQRPGETKPCGQVWDGIECGGGCLDACVECRAAANAVLAAAVAVLVDRAAEIEKEEAA